MKRLYPDKPLRTVEDLLCTIIAAVLITYLILCPLLHTFGVELDWWSWVYWLGEYIDTLK